MISEYEAPSVEPLSPGTALKKARKALGLTVEEVAGELRLSASQIRALECDDYSDLPGLTYVRGYLRSYARLVKVDEQSVLPPLQPEPTAKPMPAVAGSIRRQTRSSDRWVRLVSYGLGISLTVLVVLWWRSQGGLDFDQDLFADRTNTEKIGNLSDDTPNLTLSNESRSASVKTDTSASVANTKSLDADADKRADSVGSEQVVAARDERRSERRLAEEFGQGVRTAVTATDIQQIGKLKLQFADASWVEIRDAKNQRLVHESFNPGRILQLEGTPPFRVFLGNAAGVSMEINGKPFDITPHQTGLYARFVVGAQEEN